MLQQLRLSLRFELCLILMIIKPRRFGWGVLFGSVMFMNTAAADDALQLLTRMQTALRSLNYSGQLAYSQGAELATYRITHHSGQEQDSVVRLDASETAQADKTESFSLSRFDSLYVAKEQNYSFDFGSDMRVAGQNCKVVVARPKDKLRYLHRYCINPDTAMLLKYSMMDRDQKILEQLVFTQLTVDGDSAVVASDNTDANRANPLAESATATLSTAIAPAPAMARMAAPTAQAREQPKASAPDNAKPSNNDKLVFGHWDFSALPAGFKVVKVVSESEEKAAPQIILSDGMTSVSIFVSPNGAPKVEDNIAMASGATHILSHDMAGHSLTFVGEVPLTTLQAIQKGLRYVD